MLVQVGVQVPPQLGQRVQRVDVGLDAAGADQPHGPGAQLKGIDQLPGGLLHRDGQHGQAVAGAAVAGRGVEEHPVASRRAGQRQRRRAQVGAVLPPGSDKLAVAVVRPEADHIVGQVQGAGLQQLGHLAVGTDADGRRGQLLPHHLVLGLQDGAQLFAPALLLQGDVAGGVPLRPVGPRGQDLSPLLRQAEPPDQLVVLAAGHGGGPQPAVIGGAVGKQRGPAGQGLVKGAGFQRHAGGLQPPQAHRPGQGGGVPLGQGHKVAAAAQKRLKGHLPVQAGGAGVPVAKQLPAGELPAAQPHRVDAAVHMLLVKGDQFLFLKPLVVPEPEGLDAQAFPAQVEQRVDGAQVVRRTDDHGLGALQVNGELLRAQLPGEAEQDLARGHQVPGVERHLQIPPEPGHRPAQRLAGPLGRDRNALCQQKFHTNSLPSWCAAPPPRTADRAIISLYFTTRSPAAPLIGPAAGLFLGDVHKSGREKSAFYCGFWRIWPLFGASAGCLGRQNGVQGQKNAPRAAGHGGRFLQLFGGYGRISRGQRR